MSEKTNIYPVFYLLEKFNKNELNDCRVLFEYPVSTNYLFTIEIKNFIASYTFLKTNINFGKSKNKFIDHLKIEGLKLECFIELTEEQSIKFNVNDFKDSDMYFKYSLITRSL